MKGSDLKEARRKLGLLTQKQMEKMLHLPHRTYQDYERGISPVPGPVVAVVDLLLKYNGAVKYLLGRDT